MEFIWYCPRKSCNAIVLKTNEPYLAFGKKYKCKRCNEQLNAEQLVSANKRNIRKYLDEVEKRLQ